MGVCGSVAGSSYRIKEGTSILSAPKWAGVMAAPGNINEKAFTVGTGIGKGKFGSVFLGQHTGTEKYYAMKYIPKAIIYETKAVDKIQEELMVMQKLDHPFTIRYLGGFETKSCITMISEFAFGGELYTRMKQDFRMSESVTKFYAAEIAEALNYLHNSLHIVYRDLKPENILISGTGHIKLCDFGFAVSMNASSASGPGPSTSNFLTDNCGTAMYVAPEIVAPSGKSLHSFPADWWSFGCVVYEMATGKAPFGDSEQLTKFEIFTNISSGKVGYPMSMSSELSKLLKGLLNNDPSERFEFANVKTSSFMEEISWSQLVNLKIDPPWVPTIESSRKAPSTECFVSWPDLSIPSDVPEDAKQYCRSLKIPAPAMHAFHASGTSPDGSPMLGKGAGGGGGQGTAARKSMKKATLSSGSPDRPSDRKMRKVVSG